MCNRCHRDRPGTVTCPECRQFVCQECGCQPANGTVTVCAGGQCHFDYKVRLGLITPLPMPKVPQRA